MKVLFILDFPLAEWKGTQRWVYEIATYMKSRGNEVVLVERNLKTDYSLDASLDVPFKLLSLDFGRLSSFSVLKKVIKTERPDIVYSANIINPFIPTFGAKTIFGSHVLNVSAMPYLKLRDKYRFYTEQLFLLLLSILIWKRKMVMFHAENEDQLKWLTRLYLNRYKVENLGAPINKISDEDLMKIIEKKKNKKFRILYFGSLDRARGFKTFLNVVDQMNRTELLDSIEFLIAGNGTMSECAKKYQNKYSNVEFVYKPDEKTKDEMMINSDLFVFPSYIENFSVATVEAQMRGLPAIVPDIAPLKSIVIQGKTGFYFPPIGSEAAIVEATRNLYNMWQNDYDSYKKMRIYILEQSKRFDKEMILPKYEKVMHDFLVT